MTLSAMVVMAGVVVIFLASAASAAPPPVSAVSQYVEIVPTSTGGQAPGGPSAGSGGAGLPARLSGRASAALSKLGASTPSAKVDAQQLHMVLTDPAYGTQPQRLSPGNTTQNAIAHIPAALGAIASGNGLAIPLLGAAMLLTTIGAVAAGLLRTRRTFEVRESV
jgi:hypothetical protein